MRPQLIIDCGSRVLSALLVLPDGQALPISHPIRGIATRHFSSDVLFDPRVIEHPDFVWDDAIESLAKARPHDFFQRARRVGLRRPWDGDATSELLRLARPMHVLSSPAALADGLASHALLPFTFAVIDALLDPAFTFVADRRLTPREVDLVLILPPHAGRAVRCGLQRLARRRDYARPLFVHREVAAALSLLERENGECVIVDATDDDLHIHRITFAGTFERSVRSVRSSTLHNLGWSHWVSRIAVATGITRSAAFDRSLLSLLTGSPDSLSSPMTHAALSEALDERWAGEERTAWTERIRQQFDAIGVGMDAPCLLIGEIFAIDSVRDVFGARMQTGTLELPARGVAAAMRWLYANPSRTLRLTSAASVRINTLHGDAVPLLDGFQLPAAGESCHLERELRFAGESIDGDAFLVHLLWGTSAACEANATLAALPVRRRGNDPLRVSLSLRRSSCGAVLRGNAAVSAGRDRVIARFSHEVEVRR